MYAAGDEWLFGGSGVVFHQTIYIFWRQAHLIRISLNQLEVNLVSFGRFRSHGLIVGMM
jgi:hypothetical protein